MKNIFLYLLITNACYGMTQDSSLSNPLMAQQDSCFLELRRNGIDTILFFTTFSVSQDLHYYGTGFVAWRKGKQYFIRHMEYNNEKKEVVSGEDKALNEKVINRFFSSGHLSAFEEHSLRWAPSKQVKITMQYGHTFWTTDLHDYDMARKKPDACLKWIFQLNKISQDHFSNPCGK